MSSPRLRLFLLAATTSVALLGCTGNGLSAGPVFLDNVGRIPGVGGSTAAVIVNGVHANLSSLDGLQLGESAKGNRLLVIGDSILAGSASRYGGALCSALVPLGWRVALEAEPGQLIGFGRTVLQKRLVEGWDAAVVFLGTNYGGDAERYQNDLEKIVSSLAPRPTLLLTATLFRPIMQDVNQVIRVVAAKNSHVSVLDWSSTSIQPGLLHKDKIHPTDSGRQVLVTSIAAAAGDAPSGKGACLASLFTDDSLVTDVMPTTSASGAAQLPDTSVVSSTSSTVSASPTTTISRTTTTVVAG